MAGSATDTEIRHEVLDALRYDVRIDETNLAVDVANGVVYLYGTVPTYVQKITAAHETQRIKGVRTVVNDLEVRPVTPWTDDAIARIIRGTLNRDARIANPARVHGSVTHGVVELTGTVESAVERDAAASDVRVAPGVVEVINNLRVAPPQVRRDADVAAEVRKELANDPDIDATGVDVNVLNGTVFLRGTVPSDYDKHEAQHDTWCVAGVRDVVNELRIAA